MFDDPFLSDYKLHLRTPEQQELACLNIHGVVLAGQSPYFKSLLSNWMGANERAVSLTITEEELAPMLQLLQCAYRGRVVGEVTAQKLVATILLADRWGRGHWQYHQRGVVTLHVPGGMRTAAEPAAGCRWGEQSVLEEQQQQLPRWTALGRSDG